MSDLIRLQQQVEALIQETREWRAAHRARLPRLGNAEALACSIREKALLDVLKLIQRYRT